MKKERYFEATEFENIKEIIYNSAEKYGENTAFILKQIYSIDEIKKMLDLAIKTSPIDQSYNRFCSELEKAIKMTFTGENYINNNRLSKEQYLLRNAVQSFANKLYVQKVFLERD